MSGVRAWCVGLSVATVVALAAPAAQAQSYHTLYSFSTSGGDGRGPTSDPLVADAAGNLYGTAVLGGAADRGTVFKLDRHRHETILHSFTGMPDDGSSPTSGLVADAAGNLYGTTQQGGTDNDGTVYKITPDGTETVLYSFKSHDDGMWPVDNKLLLDADGNLYGMTANGGGSTACQNGCGVVYRLGRGGDETVLHAFTNGNDGALPRGGLIADAAGNLYGATVSGGRSLGGTVFKLAPTGKQTVLYAFRYRGGEKGKGKRHSIAPTGLVMDAAGNIYGAAAEYGHMHRKICPFRVGCGSLFEITTDGRMHVLHSFTGGEDGSTPNGNLILDAAGSLYGTTFAGGNEGCDGFGCGTLFRYSPDGSMATLHAFAQREGSARGAMLTKDGVFYGTTGSGNRSVAGSVFRFKE